MTYFDDFAGNFVAAEMKEQKKKKCCTIWRAA